MMRRLLTALAMLPALSLPAAAHHPMGGAMPATAMEGFLSGLGHPVIEPDHPWNSEPGPGVAVTVKLELWRKNGPSGAIAAVPSPTTDTFTLTPRVKGPIPR